MDEGTAAGSGDGRSPRRERGRIYIGTLLVQAGLITEEQLQEALHLQRTEMPTERTGAVLVHLGYVTSEDMAKTLAHQMEVPYLGPDFSEFDPEMAELLDRDQAERLNAVPLRREGEGILVAMVHPDDMVAMDDVSVRTGGEAVYPAVVSPMTLEFFMNRLYHAGNGEVDLAPEGEVDGRVDALVVSLEDRDGDTPTVQLVNKLLQQAIEERASDLHMQPEVGQVRVRYRIDGLLHDIMNFDRDQLASVVSRFKIMAQMDISERRIPQDGRIRVHMENGSVDLRISSFPTIHGEKVVVRILDQRRAISEIGRLGMEGEERTRFQAMLDRPWGMILVAGPTGSGKSTTLTAGLHEVNKKDVNIMTLEDPVEYRISGVNQSQTRPRAGFTFASGLRSIVRQDPDIIMIGEIRDTETAEMAVRSALTGHLVLSTVHTNNAAGTVGRILDMGIEPYLVGSTLLGVVGQRLVRRLCNSCAEEYDLADDDVERLALPVPEGRLRVKRAVGCPYCNNTGYRGRVGIFEVMRVSRSIIRLITERASTAEIQEQAEHEGMTSLVQDGIDKVIAGTTSLAEVRRMAYDLSE